MSVSHAETLEANVLAATSPAGIPAIRSLLGEATSSCCQGSAPHSQALLLSPGVEGAACRGWAGDQAQGNRLAPEMNATETLLKRWPWLGTQL